MEAIAGTSPAVWDATLSLPPLVSSDPRLLRGGMLRRWANTGGEMRQPALDHHYIVVHLGGRKRIRRSGGGRVVNMQVDPGQMSIVPAGLAFDWSTEGPIDFLRLYIRPERLNHIVREVFEREPTAVELHDRIGVDDPLLERLITTMLEEVGSEAPPARLYLEGLFDAALLRLVRLGTNVSRVTTGVRQPLAPHRLRRVKAYIEDHLARDLDVQALAEVAGPQPLPLQPRLPADDGRLALSLCDPDEDRARQGGLVRNDVRGRRDRPGQWLQQRRPVLVHLQEAHRRQPARMAGQPIAHGVVTSATRHFRSVVRPR